MIALFLEWGANLWRFLKSPLGTRVAIAFAVVAAIGYAGHVVYEMGRKHERAEYAKLVAKAERRVAETKIKSDAITAKVSTDLTAANAKIAALSTKLKSEVPRYVTPESARRCVVPRGYVLLDSAASGGSPAVSPAAGELVDADSGLDLAQLAEANVQNAAAFNTAVAEVKAWRVWYRDHADLWNKEYSAQR